MGTYKDLYIIKWLSQNSEEPNPAIVWQRNSHGMYFAYFNEASTRVRVDVGSIQARPCARIIAKFTSLGFGEIQITEPLQSLFPLRKKYASADEQELAEAMKRLLKIISNQHSQRELHDIDNEEERKQAIYHRLLGNT